MGWNKPNVFIDQYATLLTNFFPKITIFTKNT